jgi:hypothetical protein
MLKTDQTAMVQRPDGTVTDEPIFTTNKEAPEYIEIEGYLHDDHPHWTARRLPGPDVTGAVFHYLVDFPEPSRP